jgi:coatomer protein complex subunit gamma
MVDSTAAVSAGALVSSYHLYFDAKDIVKRWVNEIQGTLTNKKTSASGKSHQLFLQYHAIGLLYQIRQTDKMALIKLIQTYKNTSCNQYALCMISRYAGKIAEDESNDDEYVALRIFL